MRDPAELLTQIQCRLAEGMAPMLVIEEFLPRTGAEAVALGRRLPLFDEYRAQFSSQVVAIARVLCRRGMCEFGLKLNHDGHVVEKPLHRSGRLRAETGWSFRMILNGEELWVNYTPNYFPDSEQDLLAFVSPHEPARPHALSQSGHWSHFTSRDAIEACGGPERYAAALAEAVLRGDREFDAVFNGIRPETGARRQKRVATRPAADPESIAGHADRDARKVVGPHSERVADSEKQQGAEGAYKDRPEQRFLF